ncbi:hypothetical protein [Halalkalibacter sp. APA_J-10(15)]|uniref:hypothetical protein n=1 Tax=unclassified Halalkalibacter TaxID=2893063 RepID=UPI001FF662CB|nr:hypothetical protein [Halalkalibacter sp. APA_J-10(15)]MCK0473244.1 hypothetical protein [Halalkalibacter sp. APA_J-10(15)]
MKRLFMSFISLVLLFGCKYGDEIIDNEMFFDTQTEAFNYFELERAQGLNLITTLALSDDEQIFFYRQNDLIRHMKVRYEDGAYKIIESASSYRLPDADDVSFITYSEEEMNVVFGKVFDSDIKDLVYKTQTRSEKIELDHDGYFYFFTNDFTWDIEWY